ncbi:MAG: type II toxin-antitoxin system PemK/MazF family toxin [Planctomycetales bacterium]
MAINFHPGYGTILYCNFDHQTAPEMVKSRPVVVLSRKNSNVQLCTVVPLSGTEPMPLQGWHHKMTFDKLPKPMQTNDWWAKCDCIASVCFSRLDRIKVGKDPNTGRRIYDSPTVYGKDLHSIKMALMDHLGMLDLILPRT